MVCGKDRGKANGCINKIKRSWDLKKIHYFMMVGLLAGAMTVLPGISHSALRVGGETGANFIGSSDVNLRFNAGPTETFNNASIKPSVLGGITLGYDFVKEGFAGYNLNNPWPL